ncbi:MAG: hypothetical protein IAF38_09465 [Bacteroidia bacterium]|nr:hypothetical protein [Bacteroidia bacterium]
MEQKKRIFFLSVVLPLLVFSLKSQNKFFQGLSYGFGYSGFDYGTGSLNKVFSSPATFYTGLHDNDNKTLRGDFKMDKNRTSNGFFAHMELLAWKAGDKNLYHGPQVMVCYHKNELLTADLFGFGYFFRLKPSEKTNTGFSLGLHYFPKNIYTIELQHVSVPDSGTFHFNNKDFGDTVKVFFIEKKSAFSAELNYHLGFKKKFDIRFSAGVMFVIKSAGTTKVVSENNEQEYKTRSSMYLSNNAGTDFPLINPGYFFFRVGIYVLEFTQRK